MGFPTRACREPTSEEPRKQSLRLVKEVSLSMSWKMESFPGEQRGRQHWGGGRGSWGRCRPYRLCGRRRGKHRMTRWGPREGSRECPLRSGGGARAVLARGWEVGGGCQGPRPARPGRGQGRCWGGWGWGSLP